MSSGLAWPGGGDGGAGWAQLSGAGPAVWPV